MENEIALDYTEIKRTNLHLIFIKDFFCKKQADSIFEDLLKTPWKQEYFRAYGKEIPIPRLTAWYSKAGKTYTYSGIKNTPLPFTQFLTETVDLLDANELTRGNYNSVLLNLYRNGKDSVGLHADNERELGDRPTIASLSFGETRIFELIHNDEIDRLSLHLTHGSLLIMKGATQSFWKHQIPKQPRIYGGRINLTFRNMLFSS